MRTTIAAIVVLVGLWSGRSAATTENEFQVTSTHDLVALCTTPEADPLYTAAVNFCQGYLVGAWQYHKAMATRRKRDFVCFPDPPPTRSQAITAFLSWAKAHSEYDRESPVETLFKFLVEKWPCRK
jgi:hypothetical protein